MCNETLKENRIPFKTVFGCILANFRFMPHLLPNLNTDADMNNLEIYTDANTDIGSTAHPYTSV